MVASKSSGESGVTQAIGEGDGMGHGGLVTVSPKGQLGGAISMGREGWLALYQREIIMALKIWYRFAPFTVAWPKGRKLFKKLLPYSGKNAGHGKQLLPGRGLGLLPRMGTGASGAAGALAGAGASLQVAGKGAAEGWRQLQSVDSTNSSFCDVTCY